MTHIHTRFLATMFQQFSAVVAEFSFSLLGLLLIVKPHPCHQL